MTNILEDFSKPALVKSIEANLWEQATYFGKSSRVELHDHIDMLWYDTGIAYPMLNGVLRTQLIQRETDARIKTTVNHFRSRKLPLMWWIGPSTRPKDLYYHLNTHGFKLGIEMLGMAIDLAAIRERPLLFSDLMIKPVVDTDILRDWLHIFLITFGFPNSMVNIFHDLLADLGLGQNLPLCHYVGYLKGSPVSCSSMFLGAGVVGIYNIGTIPDQRGKGIGEALTLVSLCNARKIGYRIGVLHSSPTGFNMYQRIGFKEYCKLTTYIKVP